MTCRVVSRVARVLVLVFAGAGEEAWVRLVGPAALFEPVPDGTSRAVAVRGVR